MEEDDLRNKNKKLWAKCKYCGKPMWGIIKGKKPLAREYHDECRDYYDGGHAA